MTTNTAPVGAHLVGSVPLSDADEVFRTASRILGAHLRRMPDGETGDRREWIHFLLPVLDRTPGLVREDLELAGRGRTVPSYRLADGAKPEDVAFPPLGHADVAAESYARFRALKSEGVIPEHVRFQVSLPTPAATICSWFAFDDRAALEDVWTGAVRREVDAVLERIPHDELSIQWDVCIEVLVIEGAPGFTPWFDDVWNGALERVERVAGWIPGDVEMGIHLCYGDYKHTRQAELPDATDLVRIANALTERIDRQIAWIQLPVPRDRDPDHYLAPLRDLQLDPATELYLGLVHHTDGVDGTQTRVDAARRYVDRFGVATECGFGRRPPETVQPLMEIHRAVAAGWPS